MNKKLLKIILIIAGALLFITIIIAVVVTLRYPDNESDTVTNAPSTTNTSTSTSSTSTSTEDPTNPTPIDSGAVNTDDAAKINSLAISFTERYGSFSSDNPGENIIVLESFMTESMQAISNQLIAESRAQETGEFYGITTQVINVTITDYSSGASGATVQVSTRRTETKGESAPVSFSQTARLQLQKVEDTWKVDQFQWL